MADNEKPESKINYVDMETANVEVPQIGDRLPAKVDRLGMTVASEVFKEKAKNPSQKVLMVFFVSEDGTKGKEPLSYYPHPSPKSKIAKFVRKYGQPKVGQAVNIIRNEDGYWELDI